jgi:large subunit ribosomal protein L9
MKVILLERVEGTGVLGDVVTVKDGFARNFLLPRSKALRANSANLKTFEAQRAEIEARNVKNRETAGKSGEGLDGKQYVMIRQAGESGQLYGSVAGRDVADAIKAEGGKVDRSMIVLDKPIKTLGVHEVKVKLHAEVTVTVTLNIARSQDEADRQARGENVIAAQFEEDRAADAEAASRHGGRRRRFVRRRPLRSLIASVA